MVRKERLELSRPKALEPKSSVYTNFTTSASGVDDGARTHDNRNHNPGLYQLSYTHHRNLFRKSLEISWVTFRKSTIVLPLFFWSREIEPRGPFIIQNHH